MRYDGMRLHGSVWHVSTYGDACGRAVSWIQSVYVYLCVRVCEGEVGMRPRFVGGFWQKLCYYGIPCTGIE